MLCSTGGGPSGAAPRRIYELTLKGRKELDRRSLALMETSERVETFLTRYGSTDVACPGTAEARRIPAHLTQAVLRRPLGALNPLRRKSEPGDSPNLRQADHA